MNCLDDDDFARTYPEWMSDAGRANVERVVRKSIGKLVCADVATVTDAPFRVLFGEDGFFVFFYPRAAWMQFPSSQAENAALIISVPQYLLGVKASDNATFTIMRKETWIAPKGAVCLHVDMGGWRRKSRDDVQPDSDACRFIMSHWMHQHFGVSKAAPTGGDADMLRLPQRGFIASVPVVTSDMLV
jgi:hypothetical protein